MEAAAVRKEQDYIYGKGVSGGLFRFALTYLFICGLCWKRNDVCACALKAAPGISESARLACESGFCSHFIDNRKEERTNFSLTARVVASFSIR